MAEPGIRDASRELMGSAVTIDFLLRTLMDLPTEVFPGDERAEAIRELLTASVCQGVMIPGEDACRAATALIEKVIDRMADDVSVAAQLGASGRQAC